MQQSPSFLPCCHIRHTEEYPCVSVCVITVCAGEVQWQRRQANTQLFNKRCSVRWMIFFSFLPPGDCHRNNWLMSVECMWCTLRSEHGLHCERAQWSRLDVWLQRGGHLPSETWSERCSPLMMLFLGWLTSQLTRQCFISFFRINVCLCITTKAPSGSLTTPLLRTRGRAWTIKFIKPNLFKHQQQPAFFQIQS